MALSTISKTIFCSLRRKNATCNISPILQNFVCYASQSNCYLGIILGVGTEKFHCDQDLLKALGLD